MNREENFITLLENKLRFSSLSLADTIVARVRAHDRDAGENKRITYTIKRTTANNDFGKWWRGDMGIGDWG